jgi:hypothetical protein
MKLIHKVEESAIYESNKHSYPSLSLVTGNGRRRLKSYLLKISIPSSSAPESAFALLSHFAKSITHAHHAGAGSTSSIKFKAFQVIPLKPFIEELHSNSELRGMAYTLTLKLLADIGTQLEQMRTTHSLFIPFLSLEDVVVVINQNEQQHQDEKEEDEEKEREEAEEGCARWDNKTFDFIFINSEKLTRQQRGDAAATAATYNTVIVDVPLKVNKHTSFLPTELPEIALKRLPMRLTTTSWCYSLSALCIYMLLQHKFKNGEDDIERIGRPFLHTSLYFCLKRCLKPDPEERVLLYV